MARVRAQNALKSTTFAKQVYGVFDVPHETQDIITAEERQTYKPKTIAEIFANCKIYVEVRTGDDNRSSGIKNSLLRDGIVVNEKLYKDTTHVIFKDGLLSTYKNAKKFGVPVTNILWVEACKTQRRLVDPEKFKISNLDRYERPELYKRLRREKSMQPEVKMSFEKVMDNHMERSFSQNDSRDVAQILDVQTISEIDEEMDLTLVSDTKMTEESMTPSSDFAKMKNDFRRITTFTPNLMEQTGIVAKMAVDRRRTLFTPQLSQESQSSIESNAFNLNSSRTIIFNSANRIAKSSRRTMFDVSLNILDLNCKAMNQQKEEEDKQNEVLRATAMSVPAPKLATQVITGVVRKRKLFNAEDLDETQEYKENDCSHRKPEKKRKSLAPGNWKTPQPEKKEKSVDRRRTLAFFKTEKPKEAIAKVKTAIKPQPLPKFIVCTNMSTDDKTIIQAVSKIYQNY